MESMPDVEGMYALPNILEKNCSRTVYPCENVTFELLPKPMSLLSSGKASYRCLRVPVTLK